MAKVITLQILVRDNDEQRIEDGLKDMLTAAQSLVDPDDQDPKPWLASWSIKNVDSVNEAVEAALESGGEELESILEKEFVICFGGARIDEAFYSSAYGPTSLDLAKKFSAASVRECLGLTEQGWQEWLDKNKAYVVQTPYGLTRYTAKFLEPSSQGESALSGIKTLEFWASDDDQARDKVEQAYPCENIISVKSQ